ncbi:class I SAM-dependent methyltransferase [Aureimonas sp. AU12]|uniref:class I SAM-dependent methyltransferase n=1 Tax=Aureimonas sp. AU12 TaxID=1638161 RepID=UPI00078049B4|nr:class I SAM-dependent methyltransferase [Aureimonas sp. AU12]
MTTPADLHEAARIGFGAEAEAYARGRPEYPAGIVDWLRDELGLGSGHLAVDLGAGTGKFTGRLLETGAEVVAIEPIPEMRAQLNARHPGLRILEGSAQAIPLPEASADAIVCAQAFHWFATREALAEIRRVLRPGGSLGLVWNVRDESVPWVAALSELMRPHEGTAPRFYFGAWRAVFPAEGFGPLEVTRLRNHQRGEAERVIVDRTLSVSFIANLPSLQRSRFEADLRDLIAATPELRDAREVTFPYETVAYRTIRTG